MNDRARTAIASEFLIELPRDEMEMIQPPGEADYFEGGGSDREDFIDADPDDRFDGIDEIHPESDIPTLSSAIENLSGQLTTAAAMAAGQTDLSTQRMAPEDYAEGMLVEHPKYGPGRVERLSGKGEKRTAMIRFFTGEEKKFRLAFAPLSAIEE